MPSSSDAPIQILFDEYRGLEVPHHLFHFMGYEPAGGGLSETIYFSTGRIHLVLNDDAEQTERIIWTEHMLRGTDRVQPILEQLGYTGTNRPPQEISLSY